MLLQNQTSKPELDGVCLALVEIKEKKKKKETQLRVNTYKWNS